MERLIQNFPRLLPYSLFYLCKEIHRLPVLKWFSKSGRLGKICQYPLVLYKAVEHGRVDSVKYLLRATAIYGNHLFLDYDHFHLAVRNGHIDMVKYLWEYGRKPMYVPLFDAGSNGHLEMIRYICEVMNLGYVPDALDGAIHKHQWHVVKYLFSQKLKRIKPTTYQLENFIRAGNLEWAEYCCSRFVKIPEGMMEWVGEEGTVEMIQFLQSKGIPLTKRARVRLRFHHSRGKHSFPLSDLLSANQR